MRSFRILLLLLLLPFLGHGQDKCFPAKDDRRLVYDISGVLGAQAAQLETKLQDFARTTSNQIVVVIVDDLCGYDKAVYATELGEAWGVGQKKEDNGVVLLVKPKTPEEKGETFIAIGRGLEHVLPDASTYLIVENELLPSFRQGNYFEGVDKATNVIMEVARGEYSIADYGGQHQPKGKKHGWAPFLFFLLVIGLFFVIKSVQVRRYARLNHIDWWSAWWLLNATRSQHRGYWGDFTGGRGGFGGGGGGGFGGFGGGSFGGGGSGGSW